MLNFVKSWWPTSKEAQFFYQRKPFTSFYSCRRESWFSYLYLVFVMFIRMSLSEFALLHRILHLQSSSMLQANLSFLRFGPILQPQPLRTWNSCTISGSNLFAKISNENCFCDCSMPSVIHSSFYVFIDVFFSFFSEHIKLCCTFGTSCSTKVKHWGSSSSMFKTSNTHESISASLLSLAE